MRIVAVFWFQGGVFRTWIGWDRWSRKAQQWHWTIYFSSATGTPPLFSLTLTVWYLLSLHLTSQLSVAGSSLEKEITELSLIHTSKFDATDCSPWERHRVSEGKSWAFARSNDSFTWVHSTSRSEHQHTGASHFLLLSSFSFFFWAYLGASVFACFKILGAGMRVGFWASNKWRRLEIWGLNLGYRSSWGVED